MGRAAIGPGAVFWEDRRICGCVTVQNTAQELSLPSLRRLQVAISNALRTGNKLFKSLCVYPICNYSVGLWLSSAPPENDGPYCQGCTCRLTG